MTSVRLSGGNENAKRTTIIPAEARIQGVRDRKSQPHDGCIDVVHRWNRLKTIDRTVSHKMVRTHPQSKMPENPRQY
jgi:hypothetical protein